MCQTRWKEGTDEDAIGSIGLSTHASNRLGRVAFALAGRGRRGGLCIPAICVAAALGKRALPGGMPQPWDSAGGSGADAAYRINACRHARFQTFGDIGLPGT